VEVVRGSVHAVFPMEDTSRVGQARRHAAQVSEVLGFDEVTAGRVALVVTELGTNLVKHARNGRLMIASREFDQRSGDIEILSIDEGPGIADLGKSMRDGVSTAGTPGTGLGAARRLANDFDIYSEQPAGTVIVARIRAKDTTDEFFRVGVAGTSAPGETVSGDGWAVAIDGARAAILMADGLGHGPMAEQAANVAVGHFCQTPFQDMATMIQSAHGLLRSTRGAAVALAALDIAGATVRSVGAGNVVTRIVSGVSEKTLLSQHGTVGLQIRKPEEMSTPWPPHAVVVMHTDGVVQRWPSAALHAVLGRDPSLVAAVLLRDFCRGRDDATVMVIRRKE
jgi:anti-sigma regulatory factor (Ser/Thr protein kinase)